MPTIAHISDLHLQSTVPARQAQVEPILKAISDAKPDLVVISGDVTDDGWDSIDELRWANKWLSGRIGCSCIEVPGNHDVGNFANSPKGRISDARVQAWDAVNIPMPSWDSVAHNLLEPTPECGWLVFGINSMLFGSDSASEQNQNDKLSRWLELHDDPAMRFAAVLHSPLFSDRPDEAPDGKLDYWLGPGLPRRALWQQLKAIGIKLICSGHVHQTRLTQVDGIHIAWAPPASGTWVHAPGLPNPPMPEKTGFFLHHLGDDGSVRSELVECAPMLKLYRHQP